MNSKVIPGLTDTEATPTGAGYQPRTLVLLGAGRAHVHVLATLALKPMVGVRVLLVSPHPRQLVAAMVPGFVAGHYTLDDCAIALEPLVQRAGVRWLECSARALDTHHQCINLDDGTVLDYDWLSINTGGVQDREAMERSMPGARTHALFVRPTEGFTALWPRVAAMGTERALRMAVVGGAPLGIEMACALRQRFPSAAVTLVCGKTPLASQHGPTAQLRVLQALRQRRVTVLQEEATGFNDGVVRLGCGATLACDIPLLATQTQAPAWLRSSGLALDADGCITSDATLRSSSHSNVFAVGSVSSPPGPRPLSGGNSSVTAGPVLAHNLAAAALDAPLLSYPARTSARNLLSLGDYKALGMWGPFSAQGRWVWWLKNWLDQRFVARYTKRGP